MLGRMHRLTLLVLLIPAAAAAATPDRPNIVYIMADDQGYGDLGVQGHPYIRTPNIDRLAREGVRLTDFYAQPFCGPSRAALMTGSYPARNSLAFNHLPRAKTGIHPNEITIAEILRDQGYATAIVGKWHLGDAPEFLPTRHGFDYWYGLPYSNDMWPYHPKIEKRPGRRRADEGFPQAGRLHRLCAVRPGLSARLVSEAAADAQRRGDRAQPAAGAAGGRLHRRGDPLYAGAPRPALLRLPGAFDAARAAVSQQAVRGRVLRGRYGDVVEEIDANVGRILAAIDEMGLDEKTLVVFTSDNGPWVEYGFDAGSAGPLRGSKGTNYEGGVRVPFLARFPGRIPAGLVSSGIASNIDILPTLAKLAGGAPPSDRTIDGVDIWELLTEPEAESPRKTFFYYVGGMKYLAADGPPKNDPTIAAVRRGKWKLHVGSNAKGKLAPEALYNLYEDIGEQLDYVSKEPDLAEELTKLAQKFNDDLRKDTRPHGALTKP